MNYYLFFLSLSFIILTPIDYILFIQWMDSMQNYSWYASGFIFPLIGVLLYKISIMIITRFKIIAPPEHIIQKEIMYMGSLDSVSSIMTSFTTPYLSIILMTILDKLTLPLILFFSIIFLKKKFFKNHYLAIFLTIYAICVSYLPNLSDGKYNLPLATIVFILSLIPSSLSFIIKEKYMMTFNLDVWNLNLWTSIWQLIFGIIMFPLVLIPFGKRGINYIPANDINTYFIDATKCQFLGIGNHCKYSFLFMILYQIICLIVNILMLEIIKYGSSVYFNMINTLKLPIQAFLASFPSIAGNNYTRITINHLFTFILIIVSIFVYNDQNENSMEEKLHIPINSEPIDIYSNLDKNMEDNMHDHL